MYKEYVKKIEVMVTSPIEFWDNIQECLTYDVNAINTYPVWIDSISKNGTDKPIGLIIDYPINMYGENIAEDIIKYYSKKYSHIIKYINIPLIAYDIFNYQWNNMSEYLKNLSKSKSKNIDFRLILDISLINDNTVEKILNIAEQSNMDAILISSYLESPDDEDDFNNYLIDINALAKNITIPIGIIGDITSKSRLEKAYKAGLDPIIIDNMDIDTILAK